VLQEIVLVALIRTWQKGGRREWEEVEGSRERVEKQEVVKRV
jgi:hypothetical protein